MRASVGISGVKSVPDQPAVVCGLILCRVKDINVNYMRRELIHVSEPAEIAAAHELIGKSRDWIILVVIVRHQWLRPFVIDGFMVGIDVAEMSPAIFVNY